jgi:hypothetical protein
VQYTETKSLIGRASVRASDAADTNSHLRTKEADKGRLRDHNILDILARIRSNDTERGEEVLQHNPASPTATTPTGVGSALNEESCNTEHAHSIGTSEETNLDETFWDLEFESGNMLDPFTAVFDDFGGPIVNFQSPDLNQL